MLKSGAGKFVTTAWYQSVQTRTLPLSPSLNLSGAPGSPDVGLCAAMHMPLSGMLSVQNAGESVRM